MPTEATRHNVACRAGETPAVEVTLLDEDGAAVPLAGLSTLTLTYTDTASALVINSRTAQNVKNANNGTFHATSGLFRWDMQAADTALPSGETQAEYVGVLTVTTSGGKVRFFRIFVTISEAGAA